MKEESSWVDRIEENLIAVILGTMALLTFANVVARYVLITNKNPSGILVGDGAGPHASPQK